MSVDAGEAALNVSALLDRAAERSGTSDWGDLSFTEPLGLLLRSCARTGDLTAMGSAVLHKVVLRHLRNRLYLRTYLARHGDRLARPVQDAVVVTGLPRTGTTLLHNLLALDPANRVLRLWEALHPVPPEPGGEHSEAELIAQAGVWLERMYELAPDFRAIHAGTPEGPEECDTLLQNEFASQHFDDMFDAEEYSQWLYGTTLARPYASYALQLRVLTRPEDSGRTWVLKSPSHLAHLDSLLAACPGTTVVHCHRDPLEAVPSYASLIVAVRSPYAGAVSPARAGHQALRRCAAAMDRAMSVRRSVGDEPFVDVAYKELVGDPVAVVRSVYGRLGRFVSSEFEAAVHEWVGTHPRHAHGVHRYSLDRFGLSRDSVTAALAPYLARFGALAA